MLEVITGEDRYRVLTQKRKLAKEGTETVSGLTEEVKSSAGFVSLFGTRKYIVECRTLEDFAPDELLPFVQSDSSNLYIFPEDSKSGKCMMQLEKAGVSHTRLDKYTEKQLSEFVVRYVAKAHRRLQNAAYELLVSRCAYFESPESDLGTVVNELDKLIAACSNDICVEDVEKYTQVIPAANIFDLSDLILQKKRGEALLLANKLMQNRDFDALRTMAVIEQCFRVGYKASLLTGPMKTKAQALGVRYVRQIDSDTALNGLQLIAKAREDIKASNSAEAIFIRLICQLTEKEGE